MKKISQHRVGDRAKAKTSSLKPKQTEELNFWLNIRKNGWKGFAPEEWRIAHIHFKQYLLMYINRNIDLNESQWWSIDKLEAFQNKRLRKIIKYAYNNIPGYRRKFDEAKVKPEDIRTKEDLRKLPITTREELQNNKDFVNENLISGTLYTGGSTGTSLKYYESAESGKIRWESHLRGWMWDGYTLGKRLAVISSAQGMVSGENAINLIGDLTTENLEKNVNKLIEFKPQHLRGYVGSLYILARYCLDNNIELDGIESINTISENLYEYQRRTMEEAFDCDVFDEYCCNDGGACAWECSAHEGLHYFMERAIIEDVDGEMVVTDLWNRAMPFIRYKNGDSVKFLKKKCSCGRELPLITVKGRTNDILISKEGPISPTYIMHSWYDGAQFEGESDFRVGFRAVQYVQKNNYFVVINIVKNRNCTEKMIADFEKQLKNTLHGMTYQLNFVEDIPATKKGKRAFIVNEDEELLKKTNYFKR